jgi:hypothetical protein
MSCVYRSQISHELVGLCAFLMQCTVQRLVRHAFSRQVALVLFNHHRDETGLHHFRKHRLAVRLV